MKSLDLIEELNKILIDANKRKDIAYENVGENDRQRSDLEHDVLNEYYTLTAKQKREKLDELFGILVERHRNKYEYRELEILKELYNLPGLENALNTAISKLRKLNLEIEKPIYYRRAKKNKGEVIKVKEKNSNEQN